MMPSPHELDALETILEGNRHEDTASVIDLTDESENMGQTVEVAEVLRAALTDMSQAPDEVTVRRIAVAAARERPTNPDAVTLRVSRVSRAPLGGRAAAVAALVSGVSWKVAFGVAAAAAAVAGAGANGSLPDPVQAVLADASGLVSLDLPHPDDPAGLVVLVDDPSDPSIRNEREDDTYDKTPTSVSDASTPTTETEAPSDAQTPGTTINAQTPGTTIDAQTPGTTTKAAQGTGNVDIDPGDVGEPAAVSVPELTTRDYAVGVAGSVVVTYGWDSLTLDNVTANPGWVYEIGTHDVDQVDITFSSPDGDATFTVQIDEGNLQIDIDPGDVGEPAAVSVPELTTRDYAVGVAGSVVVTYGWDSLTLDNVTANPGWVYEIGTHDVDQVDITFSSPDGDATFTAQIDEGNLQIDIDPGDA